MDHPIPTVRQRAVLPVLGRSARHLMLLLGFVCTAVGIAGLILPLLPVTVFLLIATWLFPARRSGCTCGCSTIRALAGLYVIGIITGPFRQGPSFWPSP